MALNAAGIEQVVDAFRIPQVLRYTTGYEVLNAAWVEQVVDAFLAKVVAGPYSSPMHRAQWYA
jgi:hypothetical protein